MTAKKSLLVLFLVLVVAGGAFYSSKGGDLQGKLPTMKTPGFVSGTASSSTSTTVTPILTVTNHGGRTTSHNITWSAINFDWTPSYEDEVGPNEFTLGTIDLNYADGATSCPSSKTVDTNLDVVTLNVTSGGVAPSYYDDEIFSTMWLDVVDTNDNSWPFSSTVKSNFYQFPFADFNLSGNHYQVNINAKIKKDIDPSDLDQSFKVYFKEICATKDGNSYVWQSVDNFKQNKYFTVAADSTNGLLIGTFNLKY